MNPPSQYEEIWTQLKATGRVSLTANKLFHSRIIKAVIKRKYIDTAFKIQMLEENSTATLENSAVNSIITFTLVKKKRYNTEARYRKPVSLKEI